MQRAGAAAFAALLDRWPGLSHITVFCGKGNNAGDGYLIAGLAAEVGITVQLVQLGDPATLADDAALARDWADAKAVQPQACATELPQIRGQMIVDALLGTGLTGAPRGLYAAAIEQINDSGLPVLAVDVPSGVDADTGGVAGSAVNADVTVTFIVRKLGTYTGTGRAAAGEIRFADLGVGTDITDRDAGVLLLEFDTLPPYLHPPRRTAAAYKHALGHVLVVGGDESMGGAPLLAGEAALRVGAGMVTVATRACHRPAMLARRPELMVVDADDGEALHAAFERASTLIVGPGLGRASWGRRLLEQSIEQAKPMLLDADGLNGLAASGLAVKAPTVVTPHASEAATLLGQSVAEVQLDRPAAALALAERVAAAGCGVSVLKGAGSVIAEQNSSAGGLLGVCGHGNPGMASAGMGDVLSGVIGGLMAQGMSAAAAAQLGVTVHSRAADVAVERTGERGLLATDLLPEMMRLLK